MAAVKPLLTDREPVAGGGGMIGFTSPRSGAPLWPEGDALVSAVDLSAAAVETNRRNIGDRANYTIAQADIRALPFPAGAFDVVVCLGVLQHTPSPERSLAALWRMVAPGGLLVLDHYTWTLSR